MPPLPPRKAKRKPKRSPKKRPTPKNPKLRKNPKRLHRIHAARSETPRALPPRRIRRRKSPKPNLHRPRAHALPREAPRRLRAAARIPVETLSPRLSQQSKVAEAPVLPPREAAAQGDRIARLPHSLTRPSVAPFDATTAKSKSVRKARPTLEPTASPSPSTPTAAPPVFRHKGVVLSATAWAASSTACASQSRPALRAS